MLKEVLEILPIIAAVRQYLSQFDSTTCEPITILDLCSGFTLFSFSTSSFFSLSLFAIYLVFSRFPFLID